jgi:hypothetical protein
LRSKQEQIENIIVSNSSKVKELKTPEDFKNLELAIKFSEDNINYDREITKLVNQINDMKASHEQDANTNADMYSSMQAKLIAREEVFLIYTRKSTK